MYRDSVIRFMLSPSCFFSPLREDKVLSDCFEECCGGVRLGPKTIPQIHGFQGW